MTPTTLVNIVTLPLGWQLDPRYVYIGRAGRGLKDVYGNRHRLGWCSDCKKTHNRHECIALFRAEATARFELDAKYRDAVEALRGRQLVCFCAPMRCHGAVYLELLGEEAT